MNYDDVTRRVVQRYVDATQRVLSTLQLGRHIKKYATLSAVDRYINIQNPCIDCMTIKRNKVFGKKSLYIQNV